MSAAPYSIGSSVWPGISKVAEESCEVGQVIAKIIGCGGETIHFDGSNLTERLQSELGDLLAAIGYVIDRNHLDHDFITRHAGSKLTLFNKWHEENK